MRLDKTGAIHGSLTRAVPASLRRMFVYACVGGLVSLLYSFFVILCVQIVRPLSPTVGSVVAFALFIPVAYFMHAKVSFSDRSYDAFQPLRFAFSTTASFVVSIGGMYWITEIAGRDYLLGVAWNWVMIPALNYLTNISWVFRTQQDTGARNAR